MTQQMSDNPSALHPTLDRVRRPALIVGGATLLLCILLALATPRGFFSAYLVAFLFWLGVPLGCLALLMLQNLTGGRWGLVIRRFLEAGTRTLPLMAVLFLPLLLGLRVLYIWARPDAVRADPLLQYKAPYLNIGFFILRAAICFAIWIAFALLLNRWSIAEDRTADNERIRRRTRQVSGPGLLLYVLTMSLAAIDWVMSIDPHWYSTVFPLIFITGQALLTLAGMVLLLALLSRTPPLDRIVTRDHFHDLGNLLLAFTLLWAYMQFSQFLIIWMGNLQEETPYYIVRMHGLYGAVGLIVVILHFAVPFLLLLARRTKRSVRMLSAVAGGIFVLRYVDLFWIVIPMFEQAHHDGPAVHPAWWQVALGFFMMIALPIAIGGIFLWYFIAQLARRALLPLHDPRLLEPQHHVEEFHTHHHPDAPGHPVHTVEGTS